MHTPLSDRELLDAFEELHAHLQAHAHPHPGVPMPPPVGPKWRVPVIALLLISSVIYGGWLVRRPDAVPDPAALTAQAVTTAVHDSARHTAAVIADGTTKAVSGARTQWRRVSAAAVTAPDTPDDTARAVAQVPILKGAGDALEQRAKVDSAAHATERIEATAEIASLKKEVDGWRDLARHPPRPRLGGAAQFLYDPIAQTPAVAINAAVRVAGPWDAVVRGEQRFAPGERPHAYLGAQLRF